MRYVCSSLFLLLCGLVSLKAEASDFFTSDQLKEMLVTDEQIAQNCASSIALKLNLVTVQGRSVTRCQLAYEVLRLRAQHFIEEEEKAKKAIADSVAECLKKEGAPQYCEEAGKRLAEIAVKSHEGLAAEALEAEKALASLGGT